MDSDVKAIIDNMREVAKDYYCSCDRWDYEDVQDIDDMGCGDSVCMDCMIGDAFVVHAASLERSYNKQKEKPLCEHQMQVTGGQPGNWDVECALCGETSVSLD